MVKGVSSLLTPPVVVQLFHGAEVIRTSTLGLFAPYLLERFHLSWPRFSDGKKQNVIRPSPLRSSRGRAKTPLFFFRLVRSTFGLHDRLEDVLDPWVFMVIKGSAPGPLSVLPGTG